MSSSDPLPALPLDLPPPPRRVRRRSGWASIVFLRFFVTPALVILLGVMLLNWLTAVMGERVSGHVIDTFTKRLPNESGTRFLRYRYSIDGGEIVDQQRVSGETLYKMTAGQAVAVRTLDVLGYRYSTLADGWYEFLDVYAVPIYMSLVGIFVGGGTAWYGGWVKPARARRLVRDGVATVGEITSLPILPGRTIGYSYVVDGITFEGTDNFLGRLQDMPRMGETLVVLYDPAKPSRSTAYEFGDFEIEGMRDTVP
jgi:hypothetical protein